MEPATSSPSAWARPVQVGDAVSQAVTQASAIVPLRLNTSHSAVARKSSRPFRQPENSWSYCWVR